MGSGQLLILLGFEHKVLLVVESHFSILGKEQHSKFYFTGCKCLGKEVGRPGRAEQ